MDLKLTKTFDTSKVKRPLTEPPKETHKSTIELKGICQSYGDKEIIKDLNFVANQKEGESLIVAVLGPSGCGKSTLLRYISGLQKPTSGEISLHGQPRTEQDRVGMVFQKYSSLPWRSVLENVEMGLEYQNASSKERMDRSLEMLALVELGEHANKYAQYPTLSGGQLQRVAIARSLVANPSILLMDEPFGALDIKTRLKMQELVQEICQKYVVTIVFVTHDVGEAVYLADEIVIMGGNPSKIVQQISVPFGKNRNRKLKNDERFESLVRQIEEKMMKD
jgi:NitT/TauT family transport system ATP-binding protein